MEHSIYEKINNVQLFFLIKIVLKKFKGTEPGVDSYTYDIIEKSSDMVGLDFTGIVDVNYIVSLLRLNPNYDFTSKSPSGDFERPKANEYTFVHTEFRTDDVRRTYKHEITSYSEKLTRETILALDYSGNFDYADGDEIGSDTYDGEVTDVKLDKSSIRKVTE